ncbi:MAG: glycosyltransferase family 4 protein [Malacoplasma sp.]
MMKLLVLTTIRAPYRIDLFNELGKLCDLTVCFEQEHDVIREEKWYKNEFVNFEGVVLKKASQKLSTIKFEFIKQLRENDYDLCIFYEYSTKTALLSMEYCIIHKIKYAINCDGVLNITKTFKNVAKKYFVKNASACLANGASAKRYFLNFGANPQKIYMHNFGSLFSNNVLTKIVDTKEKKELKKKLNLNEENTLVISVGNFIEGKGFNYLLDVFLELKDNYNIDLLIIGSGPMKDSFISYIKNNDLNNVIIKDFLLKEELFEYYMAADIFAFATLEDVWGLVTVEAMSFGLPIISSKNANSSLELIQNGINGYLCDLNNNDIFDAIINLYKNNELREKMGTENLKIAQKFTVERNSSDIYSNLIKVLGAENEDKFKCS